MTYIPVQRRERRERFDQERPPLVEPSGIEGRHLLGIITGISLFFFVAFFSFQQQSSASNAQEAQRVMIAAVTELDLLIATNREEMEAVAEAGEVDQVQLPGFPMLVYLSPEEALSLSDEEMRTVILDRAAALMYDQGLSSFDLTGEQDVSEFSSDGASVRFLGLLTDSNHSTARLMSIVLLLISVGVVIGAAILNEEDRFKVLGAAIALGALPGLLITLVNRFVLGAIGGGDPYADDLSAALTAMAEIPIRNYLAAFALGIVTLTLSPAIRFLERRKPETPQPSRPHQTSSKDAGAGLR